MMKYFFVFLIVIALFLLASPVIAQGDADASPMPVIIDTDMAVDDWMAILYMLQREDVQVLAVT
ncbi:MAG: nucleoside hydrolase, partial [Anaerolineae bacterium]|nr:nucleoside hydrolase [Anaerolineae bacterium]